jgi:hypothetical protein
LRKLAVIKSINIPGQALECGGFASFFALVGGVFHLAFPAFAQDWNHQDASSHIFKFAEKSRYLDSAKRTAGPSPEWVLEARSFRSARFVGE